MKVTASDILEALSEQAAENESLKRKIEELEQSEFATRQLIWTLAQAQGVRPDQPYQQADILNAAIAAASRSRDPQEAAGSSAAPTTGEAALQAPIFNIVAVDNLARDYNGGKSEWLIGTGRDEKTAKLFAAAWNDRWCQGDFAVVRPSDEPLYKFEGY